MGKLLQTIGGCALYFVMWYITTYIICDVYLHFNHNDGLEGMLYLLYILKGWCIIYFGAGLAWLVYRAYFYERKKDEQGTRNDE